MNTLTITWLFRWIHVVSACLWLGGYSAFCFIYLPFLQQTSKSSDSSFAKTTVEIGIIGLRSLTYIGLSSMVSGIFLIQWTRGFKSLAWSSTWTWLMLCGVSIAVLVMGLGDGLLRPLLRHHLTRPRRKALSLSSFGIWGLLLLAVALMTKALYVG